MADQFNLKRKDWQARPAVIIASGPSLTAEDVAIVRASREADRIRVVSVSNAFKHCATWADAFFAADRRYWRHYLREMLAAGVPQKRMVTCCNVTAEADKIARVRAANRPGLGTYQLHTGGNSGWMGLNLAFLYGARRIYLLGFDMGAAPDGKRHFDGDHPKPLVQAMPFAEWIHRIDKAAPQLKAEGCKVVNCTRRSALKCFPMSTVEAELVIKEIEHG
jgi:hypothetical protein